MPLLCSGVFFANPPHIPVFFLSPSMASESLSLACPRESNQREGHPGRGASAARRFATGGRVPLTGHPWPAAESARSLAPTPSGLFVRPSPPHTGPRIKSAPFRLRHLPPQAGEGNCFIGWALAHRRESGGNAAIEIENDWRASVIECSLESHHAVILWVSTIARAAMRRILRCSKGVSTECSNIVRNAKSIFIFCHQQKKNEIGELIIHFANDVAPVCSFCRKQFVHLTVMESSVARRPRASRDSVRRPDRRGRDCQQALPAERECSSTST